MTPYARGKEFESIVDKTSRIQGFAIIEIPSGARWVGQGKQLKAVPIPTACDRVLCKDGKVILIDCKSTRNQHFKAIDGSRIVVKPHQIRALGWAESKRIVAGFLVWFRKPDIVSFFLASQLIPNFKLFPDDGHRIGKIIDMNLVELLNLRP